jgi:hypothetical protein
MGEAKRKRREATIEDLMQAQAEWKGQHPPGNPALPHAPLSQSDIPEHYNVFATMEAAWQDFHDRFVHLGLPEHLMPDVKFTFFNGVQAAANLVIFCEGQRMLGAALDQLQADCIAYEKEAEAVLAERKADEWRTGEI